MTTFLIGGGWDSKVSRQHYATFLAASPVRQPTVACLVLDEGDGLEQFQRFATALRSAGPCHPVPVLLPIGERMYLTSLLDADALLVCGGLTPAYAAALAPIAPEIRGWLADRDRPYAGFSAGAAVAARRAVVGGWRMGDRQICPEDAGEDLDDLTVTDGLGIVPFAVDVHCAQWGTLPRLVAAVASSAQPAGVALDENTMLSHRGDVATVTGTGHAWLVTSTPNGVRLRMLGDGQQFDVRDDIPQL